MSWDYIYKKDGDPRYHYKRNRPPDANEQRVKELYNELGKSEFLKLVSDLWEHQERFGFVHDGTRHCEYCSDAHTSVSTPFYREYCLLCDHKKK
tara:strand:- start:73 stop:354 length:282 start_codon:yes stop_codon:yes gene_type:complete